MKIYGITTAIMLLISMIAFSQTKLETVTSYFPESKDLKNDHIAWYRFTVPENWEHTTARKVTLAIAVIKTKANLKREPVVFIQGGPGGSTVEEISYWTQHPLSKNHDIVLVDLRGTGLSTPKLCSDLGKKFFQILSKNQSNEQDVRDKVKISMECRQDMINQGIDLNSYSSVSVANDLHALKNALKISKWNVYGISYGTFISQRYAKIYPGDVQTLTLDSPIPDISLYYTNNTKNYLLSLQRLFKSCKEDPTCNAVYPDLEAVYYNNIESLHKAPITVEVDKSIVPSGTFTYNAEDYKIAIQQSLYNRRLVEVLPLLIYQFKERNVATLAGLVQAFSGALSLNYASYFCFTCSEVIPFNNLQRYDSISLTSAPLRGGLSFYRSDFDVCNAWNKGQHLLTQDISLKNEAPFKVLILSGGFDPITPGYFADSTAKNFSSNALVVNGNIYSHGLGYSQTGIDIISSFVDGKPITDSLKQLFNQKNVSFKTGITLNKGIVRMTGDINTKKWHYFIPLIISLIVIFTAFVFLVIQLVSKKTPLKLTTVLIPITLFLLLSFTVGIFLGINSTMNANFYLLAFGILPSWSFVFILYKVALILSLITFAVIIVKAFKQNIPLYVMIFFAIGIIHYYFMTWHFI